MMIEELRQKVEQMETMTDSAVELLREITPASHEVQVKTSDLMGILAESDIIPLFVVGAYEFAMMQVSLLNCKDQLKMLEELGC
jgi:hypothetical protein